MTSTAPTLALADIAAAKKKLEPLVLKTPVWQLRSAVIEKSLGEGARLVLKLELFQATGSFKVRGALNNVRSLTPEQKKQGVVAVSAGNHAAAVSYAASMAGTSAKVVMPSAANPLRVNLCKFFGAEVLQADSLKSSFDVAKRIQTEENRVLVHPFEGEGTVLGTATLGAELYDQCPETDVVIVPVGGGGLAAGVAAAFKQLKPDSVVIGVEPEGADSMHRSFAAGAPASIEKVSTIADSLGAPHAAPYSYALCRTYLSELALVSDPLLARAMNLLFEDAKLAVEPAGAAGIAAVLGPLKGRFAGKTVAVIISGSNIDPGTFCKMLTLA